MLSIGKGFCAACTSTGSYEFYSACVRVLQSWLGNFSRSRCTARAKDVDLLVGKAGTKQAHRRMLSVDCASEFDWKHLAVGIGQSLTCGFFHRIEHFFQTTERRHRFFKEMVGWRYAAFSNQKATP